MDRPTLAGILRTHGSIYRRRHALSPTQARAWRAIVDCRTAALGGVRERCANCGAERHVWRSCRNRHCPQCQTRAKEAWRAARLREVLPVPYAHWVFTLPHALNPLAIRHPRWLYGALFDSAAATLLELAANPRWLGAVPGFSLVLHTWSQDLRMHLHVHALITCGGLDAEGRWRTPARVGVLVSGLQERKSARGNRFFRMNISDPTGQVAGMALFPEDFDACRKHVGLVGLQEAIHHDAVLHLDAAAGQEVDLGQGTGTDHHHVARNGAAGVGAHGLHVLGAQEFGGCVVHQHLHALLL